MIPLVLLLVAAAGANLLVNPDFAKGLDGWKVNPASLAAEAVHDDSRTMLHMTVPESVPVGWPGLSQEVPVKPDQLVEAHVGAMGQHVKDGYGVYASIEFLDAKGERISFEQSSPAPADGTWSALSVRAYAPPEAENVRLVLLLNGHGEAYFGDATLTISEQKPTRAPEGPVTIEVTGETACASLIGFGAEDDGWFYNEENARRGVTQEDWAIREGRIEWMDPDWIRMFFWYKDWNPSGDGETFTFDSPNMQSHYRTLDLYERWGARVNVVGVEWGVNDPYKDPPRVAHAMGALFDHLIRTKGYTCVQDWTLSNEPNGYFAGAAYTFERFVELHRCVKEELQRRNLNVRILGSDDTDGWTWFERCVKDDRYFALADFFASHRYIQHTSRRLLPFFIDDRMKLIAGRTPVKPFVIAEFGFHDKRSGTLENPLMEEYPYAVWTSAFAIDCLNRGVAGLSIWCLHEVYYPGNGFMNYGLWDFKDNNWKPRPVYHAWSMFSRLTEPGDRAMRCVSSHPDYVQGAFAGSTLFWVNQSDRQVEVELSGLKPREVRIMTEQTLSGDRECGKLEPLEKAHFSAPPMSFGYAH